MTSNILLSLDYLAIFSPSLSQNEDDTYKQLLLYYTFPKQTILDTDNNNTSEGAGDFDINDRNPYNTCTSDNKKKNIVNTEDIEDCAIDINEKLATIGIIQGLWNFYGNFIDCKNNKNDSRDRNTEKLGNNGEDDFQIVTLSSSNYIITYRALNIDGLQIYITISLKTANKNMCYYIKNKLIQSISIFEFLYGPFITHLTGGTMICNTNTDILTSTDTIIANFRTSKLTDNLNEFYIPFWNNTIKSIHILPSILMTNPNSYKISEYQIQTENYTWDSMLNNEILLREENYLNIKDILVYNIPQRDVVITGDVITATDNIKNLGFIRNFKYDNKSISTISNWLYNLFYERILTGGNTATSDPNSNSNSGSTHNNTLSDITGRLVHNISLPLQFAYDAVHEVGNMTGVSTSLSLITDYLPIPGGGDNFSAIGANVPATTSSDNGNNNDNNNNKTDNDNDNGNNNIANNNTGGNGTISGGLEETSVSSNPNSMTCHTNFIISPFRNNLPDVYVEFDEDNILRSKTNAKTNYKLLMWCYNSIILIFIIDHDFELIYDKNYLTELDNTLIKCFSSQDNSTNNINDNATSDYDFSYYFYNYDTKQCFTSIPFLADKQDESNKNKNNDHNNLSESNSENTSYLIKSLSLLSFGKYSTKTNTASVDTTNRGGANTDFCKNDVPSRNINFLSELDQGKLNELNKYLWSIILNNHELRIGGDNSSAKSNIEDDAKIIKLDNGLLCYIENNANYQLLIVKNWYNKNGKVGKKNKDKIDLKLYESNQKNIINNNNKDRKSTRLNSSHTVVSRMPSSA
ncbi:uncharacterized protein SCODWIG_02627 [Saccharomycodes ludwigii]|uniref:CCZ1/INTU/HSP4 first Longin domain-containing protein n=1 Tax=Saccharomycodes ludwigii TaxID=36035 RepID=A0A376B876_9ASCO|nr:uncharacterized protein SCODWIG_02627 [Saccharomycodes ludwigii]